MTMDAIISSNPTQTVNDASILSDKQDVCRPAHEFHNQMLVDSFSHLIIAAQFKNDQAFSLRLMDFLNKRPGKMLAHEHTEHGRLLGLLKLLFR